MVSSFPQKENITNLRDIYLGIPQKLLGKNNILIIKRTHYNYRFPSSDEAYLINTAKGNATLKNAYNEGAYMLEYTNHTMGLPEVQKLMAEETFDVVITMPYGARMLTGLASHFGCPLIYLWQNHVPVPIKMLLGNPLQLSSLKPMIGSSSRHNSFLGRLKNFIGSMVEIFYFWAMDLGERHYYETNFPAPKYPPYSVVTANVSLILSAYHFSQGPVANLPQIVEIGGIQMDQKLNPLPEHLQQFLDNATEGVIFFSFGTNLQLKLQNQERLWDILRALGKINMKVLMKYDTDEIIPGLPKNIMTSTWLPQKEILGMINRISFQIAIYYYFAFF